MDEFKSMIEGKLDDMARYYKNKELKDITPTSLEAMSKMVDMLKDISTIESMEEYFDEGQEMSGARGRDARTGRYISRDMGMNHMNDGYSQRMNRSRRSYNNYGSYESGADEYMNRLEEIARTTNDPTKREAARMLMKDFEGTN